MGPQSIRKTYKYKLKPTTEQERALDRTLMLCRHVYNAAIEERREAWQRCGIFVGYYQQKAELPGIKAGLPEYSEVNSQVLQDVVQRVDRAFQAFFRRARAGETPGYPRFHGRNRYNSFTYPQVGEHGGARLDNGFLVLSKIGLIAVRWSRPLEGTPKTVTISREADGWYACFSCADVPMQPLPRHRPRDGHRPGTGSLRYNFGRDTHLSSRLVSQSRATTQDCPTPCLAAQEGEQPAAQSGEVARQGASKGANANAPTSTIRRRSPWFSKTTRSITKTCRRPTCSRTTISPRASATRVGASS